ncbi:aminoglycoside phosphotransferase family protein [Streptomyces sp. NPDC048506]|uniref:phosphotransferase family protein n=1 Tax=Streptomyces sp. NPDC048506 TaxID=3155028 RepID=UPI0034428A3D
MARPPTDPPQHPVPPAVGDRRPWTDVPTALRDGLEQALGAAVTGAVSCAGGFSPGVAAGLQLTDGRRVFVKAVGAEPNAYAPQLHRREARVAPALPSCVPSPRLLTALDDRGWVVLAFEWVDGTMPAQPWRAAELDRVLHAVAHLATATTPAPPTVAAVVPVAAESLAEEFRGWRNLTHQRNAGLPLDGLDPWAAARLDALAELESGWPDAVRGDALAHCDLRADNVLLTRERVFLVDWARACLAAPWLDLLFLLAPAPLHGGPSPESAFAAHPAAAGADPAEVTVVLTALTGMLVDRSRRPPPPGIPTLRRFQAAQARAALAWLRHRRLPRHM